MARIHDWTRIYWRNSSGDREYFIADDLEEGDVDEETLCIYRNDEGDTVAYRYADEEAEHGKKYEVLFNEEVLEDVELESYQPEALLNEEGEIAEEESYPAVAAFGTRALAREFSTQWRQQKGSPEALGYVVEPEEVEADEFSIGDLEKEELEAMDYDDVTELAGVVGVKRNQSHDALSSQLSGQEEPEMKNGGEQEEEQEDEQDEAEGESDEEQDEEEVEA